MSAAPVHYFAYGSNLSRSQMERRLGRTPASCLARLDGWKLVFNKRGRPTYANIVREDGAAVWGALYECTAEELRAMDRFEGVAGHHYRRIRVEVETSSGRRVAAVTYEACPASIVEAEPPSADYAARILEGAREHGLPEAYVVMLRKLCTGEPA